MKKGILLSLFAFMTISIWTLFFLTVFQGIDKPILFSNNHMERESIYEGKFKVSIDDYESRSEYASLKQDEVIQTDKNHENSQKTFESNRFPEIQEGDAIGYGDGIAIDDLLERIKN